MQGVLSRGDERLGIVLAEMKEITLSGWKKAAEEYGLDIESYVNQRWNIRQKLPWSIIDSGMKHERLCGELEKALK